jgi:hypothetical protein
MYYSSRSSATATTTRRHLFHDNELKKETVKMKNIDHIFGLAKDYCSLRVFDRSVENYNSMEEDYERNHQLRVITRLTFAFRADKDGYYKVFYDGKNRICTDALHQFIQNIVIKSPQENYVAEFICSVAQGLNENQCCGCRCFDSNPTSKQHKNEEEKLQCEEKQRQKHYLYDAFRYLNAINCRDWGYLWSHVNPETVGKEEQVYSSSMNSNGDNEFTAPYYVEIEDYDLPFMD